MNYTGKKGKVAVLLFEAKTRPDAAAELLEMAAEYLRAGEVMPEALAEYLASALDKAAKANGADRGDVLAQELMMKQSANAPTKGREFDLLLAIVKHDAKVQSLPKRISKELKKSLPEGVTVALRPLEKELVTEVMVALGVGERTAKQRIKEARGGMAEAPFPKRP